MNETGFPGTHPDDRTLTALCHNHLANPELVEDHLMFCEPCLDKVAEIGALIEALLGRASELKRPKHMKAGG